MSFARPSALSLLIAVVGACGRPAAEPAPAPAQATSGGAPRVVVLVVVDQLGEAAFERKLPFATGGFAELARRGERLVGHLPYATSATAPGHAAMGTGAPPAVTGIIGNEWWDRAAGREVKAVEDPPGEAQAARLRVDGVADVLTRARPASRAIAVALKDRSAILSLGHAGEPVWYDPHRPAMIGRGGKAPPWLGALADPEVMAGRVRSVWLPALPAGWLAAWSGGPDDAPELAITGWTASFPHATFTTPSAAEAEEVTPDGDRLVIDGALAALRDLDLDDDAPDYLVVSLSAHDYILHAFGPDSWEAWDTFLRLDHDLDDLIGALDAKAGRGGWAMILTSDHGGPSSPERRRAGGLPGARLTFEGIDAVAEQAAASVAGPGPWVSATRPPYAYLDARAATLPPETRAKLIDAIAEALAHMPGLDGAWPTASLAGGCDAREGDARAFCLSIDAERAGEVIYSPADGTAVVKAASPDTVTHGTVHRDDREVPILIVAPGVHGGTRGAEVSTLQLAPTIAGLLGVPAPPAAAAPPIPLAE
ncbi:MAG TPA: alkaline phosphatase family protein [Kofleriaceae bacterium]|nr:alkaline phosphatase family protein [Kofleriaceae bacterium]